MRALDSYSIAACTYHFPLDQLVQALKYHHQFAVIAALTAPLINRITELPDGSIAGADIKYAFVGNPDRCPSACSAQTISPNGNAGAATLSR